MIRLRSIILARQNWRSRKAIERVVPVLREYERQLAECRRGHRPGAARIIKLKKQAVTARLAAEVGRR